MRGHHHTRDEGDYDEFDACILFKEFVRRAESNFEGPELEVIKSILMKKGFMIKAEHTGSEILVNKLTGARNKKVIANLALVDSSSEEAVIIVRQRILLCPLLDMEFTHRDNKFLKSADISW